MRTPTDEELRLWYAAVRDARPLHPCRRPPLVAEPAAVPAPPPPPAAVRLVPAKPVVVARQKILPDLQPGAAPGVDKSTAERLRRGRTVVEARLDLHGMTQHEAHSALNGFLATSYTRDRRAVLVVTGKGPSPMGGVLKREVPRWLNAAPNRSKVLMFSPAQPRDGGDGALYVLLKKRRV